VLHYFFSPSRWSLIGYENETLLNFFDRNTIVQADQGFFDQALLEAAEFARGFAQRGLGNPSAPKTVCETLTPELD